VADSKVVPGFPEWTEVLLARLRAELGPDYIVRATYLMAVEHGTGVGQMLLDTTIGQKPAQLWVLAANHRAIAFYERNGFEFDGAESIDTANQAFVERRMVR